MKYTIKVTADDIMQGLPDHDTKCPVALACARVLKKTYEVDARTLCIGGEVVAWLPEAASEWIEEFDEHQGGQPFDFDVEITREHLTKAFTFRTAKHC